MRCGRSAEGEGCAARSGPLVLAACLPATCAATLPGPATLLPLCAPARPQIGYNSWDAPPFFRFREWSLDSQVRRPGLPPPPPLGNWACPAAVARLAWQVGGASVHLLPPPRCCSCTASAYGWPETSTKPWMPSSPATRPRSCSRWARRARGRAFGCFGPPLRRHSTTARCWQPAVLPAAAPCIHSHLPRKAPAVSPSACCCPGARRAGQAGGKRGRLRQPS